MCYLDDITIRVQLCDHTNWPQLLLDIAIECTLKNDQLRQLLVKLCDIEFNLKEASIRCGDHVAESL